MNDNNQLTVQPWIAELIGVQVLKIQVLESQVLQLQQQLEVLTPVEVEEDPVVKD